MKKLFALITVVGFVVLPARAQLSYTIAGGSTASVLPATTNTYTKYVNLRDTRLATVRLTFAGMDAGTDPVVLHFDGSVSGSTSTFVNDAFGTLSLAADGTTAVTVTTNLDTAGYLLMRVRAANDSATVAATNVLIQVSVKRGVEPTLPIDIIYGGTGGATALAARTSLGIAETSTNSTIPLNKGGTGATTALAARAALGVDETATNSIIPIAKGGTASATVAAAKTAFGIASGTGVTAGDGTVTNAFGLTFSALPNLAVTQYGATGTPTNLITALTVSNFVYQAGAASVSNKWVAIGAP